MKNFQIVSIVAVVALAGCATQKTLEATGGSRSDGVIELSFDYGILERPQVSLEQGTVTARERCKAWGYADAQPFGGRKQVCNMSDGMGGCNQWHVTVSYQCMGGSR